MLQIGIRYHSTGSKQTAQVLSERFTTFGHSVTLFDHSTDALVLDWLIDIDGLLSPDLRRKVASQTIVFLRTFLQFAEMDRVVYIESPYVSRSFEQVHEIWCWDILNPIETLPSIQSLFPCPIRRVPFMWSSSIPSEHAQFSPNVDSWTVHVAEKNINNMGSCVLPLVAIRELCQKQILPANYQIHHADHIKGNRFFTENILNNIEHSQFPIEFVNDASFLDWLTPNQIFFSHSRFTPLRLGLLHALWLGIPLIHNSPILRDLHPLLQSLYYTGNNIQEISAAFTTFVSTPQKWYDAVPEIQATIMARFGMEQSQDAWRTICDTLTSSIPSSIPSLSPFITIAFSDVWPGFNVQSNVIMDALRHEYPSTTFTGISFTGISFTGIPADLLIVGPFGTTWKGAPSSLPKVFYSAENWPLPHDSTFSLYLTSSRQEDATHFRLPTWMTFLDWYSNDVELPADSTDNPIRFPISLAMRPHPVPFSNRSHFCGFVVSNPICAIRNQAFHAIHQYKKVDSGGTLYFNLDQPLAQKYPGGGSGDLSKYHFFADRQFTLSFENSQAPGYITEKLLHAKIAGCIPLYWGDSQADIDFVPNSFLNVSQITDPSVLVHVIQTLESRPDICAMMASTPLLNEEKKQKALVLLSQMSQRLMSLLRPSDPIYVINLDRRADRWKSLLAEEPDIIGATRISAVDGKTITLSPSLYDLFQHNQFEWKKSIMGCLLSHLSIWTKILQEKEDLFMILEDDVRFHKGWKEKWGLARSHIPKDADLLYLGGILPPNESALSTVLKPINEYWSAIQPNTLFTPTPLPIFHFCTYSYVLTKSGAQKLLQFLIQSEQKLFLACDHLLMHPSLSLTKYVAQPLLTYCFQEEDPAYRNSSFNQIQRIDTFDSDICNNNDCISAAELAPFQKKRMNLYYLPKKGETSFELYERAWIEDMLQIHIDCVPLHPDQLLSLPPSSWFLVQRPHVPTFCEFFSIFETHRRPFHVLHLSDEFGMDSNSFYSYSMCKNVIRNYMRDDLPASFHFLLPLGYHYAYKGVQKTWEERELVWSFHGTNWFDRSTQLEGFAPFGPHSCHLQPDWNHPSSTKEKDYLALLNNSKFCPILRGNNVETFRLYEALEAGALPITTITDPIYLDWIEKELGLSSLYPWTQPFVALQDSSISESTRQQVMKRWSEWKQHLRTRCASLLE